MPATGLSGVGCFDQAGHGVGVTGRLSQARTDTPSVKRADGVAGNRILSGPGPHDKTTPGGVGLAGTEALLQAAAATSVQKATVKHARRKIGALAAGCLEM